MKSISDHALYRPQNIVVAKMKLKPILTLNIYNCIYILHSTKNPLVNIILIQLTLKRRYSIKLVNNFWER